MDVKAAFNTTKKELGFTPTYEEMDAIFFISDAVEHHGYISTQFSRTIAGRIVETYNSWIGALHEWVMPNPGSMISMEQSNTFIEEDKEEIITLMKKLLAFTGKNPIIGITKDKEGERDFINESVTLWNESVPVWEKHAKKLQQHWEN